MSRFLLLAHDGTTIAIVEHFEDALMAMRRNDAAQSVVRIADGIELASKTRFGRMRPLPAAVLS